MSTRASIADVYIVVLDVAADGVRALLFDSGARRVEGFGARLPRRAGASLDCLDEIHRLVEEAGFRIGAVVGRAENELTAEDRKAWPAFEGAAWFSALVDGAGVMLGSGCVDRDRLGLVIGETSMLGAVIGAPITAEGLTCVQIDEKRWMISGSVPEAGAAYSSFKHAIKGSIENYVEHAAADDPLLAPLDSAARRFGEIYRILAGHGPTPQVIALLKSPALARRIADIMGVTLMLSTEPEPACRGSALWALERIGAIEDLGSIAASMGVVLMGTTK